jgi:hypothetical protein
MPNNFNLDETKEFLTTVKQGATEDPGSYATTAITHFKKLLDTALALADQVQRQTEALQRILDQDFATSSTSLLPIYPTQPPAPQYFIPPGYMPVPQQPPYQQAYPYQQPAPMWPRPIPHQQPPQNPDAWEPVGTGPAQTYIEDYPQDPAQQQQGYRFPRRNGEVIALGTPLQQQAQMASADIPPLQGTFSTGGPPNPRNIRREHLG